jgi:hypothetical protein
VVVEQILFELSMINFIVSWVMLLSVMVGDGSLYGEG